MNIFEVVVHSNGTHGYEIMVVNSGKVIATSDNIGEICEFELRLNAAYADFLQGDPSNKVIL